MSTWNTRGLRGSTLEDFINLSIEKYRESGIALIQKIPTPIKPVKMNGDKQITLAYFDSKSTVDYIGVVQGIPVCFDAKECAAATFPLQNVHAHQVRFMKEFEEQGGIAFIVLHWTAKDEIYYIPFDELCGFWERMESGGRKSFTYDEMDRSWRIGRQRDVLVHYLKMIQKDLELREQKAAEEVRASAG